MLYFSYFILAFNFVYFVGYLLKNYLLRITINNEFTASFITLILGLVGSGTITSLFYTHFASINIIFIFIGFYISYRTRQSKIVITPPSIRHLLLLNTTALLAGCIQFLFYGGFNMPVLMPIDVNNYAEICYGLSFGKENHYGILNTLELSNYKGNSPYHYFDLWINLFIFRLIPSVKTGYCLLFITYPLLLSTYLIGLISLMGTLFKSIYAKLFLGLLLFFIGPIDTEFTRKIFEPGHFLSVDTVIFENAGYFFNTLVLSYHGQKHLIFYLFVVLFIHLFQKKYFSFSYLILTASGVLNIGVFPGIAGGITLFFIFNLLQKTTKKKVLQDFLPSFIVIISVVLFYLIFSSKNNEQSMGIHQFGNQLNLKGEIVRIGLRILYPITWFLLILFPSWLLMIKKHSYKNQLFILSLFVLSSSLATRILFEGFDTPQFISYILPLINVVFIIAIFSFIKNCTNRNIKALGFTLVSCVIVININSTIFHTQTRREIEFSKIYSKNYINKVTNYLKTENQPKIGYYISENNLKTIEPIFWYIEQPNEFMLSNDYFYLFSLDRTNDSQQLTSYRNHFNNYLNTTHQNNIKDNDQLLLKFIKRNKIHFISTYINRKLPKIINENIDTIAIDSKSGNMFLQLRF
jgi:hypothetical protein